MADSTLGTLRPTGDIHTFSRQGHRFALDTNTLSLFEVRRSHWPLSWKPNRKVSLSRKGVLQHRDLDREWEVDFARRKKSQHHVFLNIAHACNLKCDYCFAGGGSYGQNASFMDVETATRAINWAFRCCRNDMITFHFFGGEPMLNPNVLYQSVSRAKDLAIQHRKSLRLIVTTNGTIDLRALGGALTGTDHWITVSIDGPKEIHDRNRRFRGGQASYDVIAKHVDLFVREFGNDHLAAKATWRSGTSDLTGIAECLNSLGFDRFFILKETQFHEFPQTRAETPDEPLRAVGEAYAGLADWYTERLNAGEHLFVEPLRSVMRSILLSRGTRRRCLAGTCGWCVTPDGGIYPCHRFVGNDRYLLGSVLDHGIFAPRLPDTLIAANMRAPSDCGACWARHWCFSDCCVYESILAGNGFHEIQGVCDAGESFCNSMRDFLQMACYYVSRLSPIGALRLTEIRK